MVVNLKLTCRGTELGEHRIDTILKKYGVKFLLESISTYRYILYAKSGTSVFMLNNIIDQLQKKYFCGREK